MTGEARVARPIAAAITFRFVFMIDLTVIVIGNLSVTGANTGLFRFQL
jgi:hypothetical protein